MSIGPDMDECLHKPPSHSWSLTLTSNPCPQAYLSCIEGERLDVSLNASEWDSHVSPLDSDT